MNNMSEIKQELDLLYQKYEKGNRSFSSRQHSKVSRLLLEYTKCCNLEMVDISTQLIRFPLDTVKGYFDCLTEDNGITIEIVDQILKEFLPVLEDSKSIHNIHKGVVAVEFTMKNYPQQYYTIPYLPQFVCLLARRMKKSDRWKTLFQSIVDSTEGRIFRLNYSNIPMSELKQMWDNVCKLYPDLSAAKYNRFICKWGRKYGFISVNAPTASVGANAVETKVIAEENQNVSFDSKRVLVEESPEPMQDDKQEKHAAKSASPVQSVAESSIAKDMLNSELETLAHKLSDSFHRDMADGQTALMTAMKALIAPVDQAIAALRDEVSRNNAAANAEAALNAKIEVLEQRISEHSTVTQTLESSVAQLESENQTLREQLAALENQNAALDSKLNEAYAINSRESSLEAEKVRVELKKAFAFLYEDWLEYEFSDVSEENYESLQAIIKKAFRSLERNGIDFKGSNE